MKLISIVTPCFNEAENVEKLHCAVTHIMDAYDEYSYEHIFIDNASTDGTFPILKQMAQKDKTVKVILNTRNFGWLRSPYYGLLQGSGDAVICLSADFQDPPEVMNEFIKKWEEGYKIAIGIKNKSKENKFIFAIRRFFYYLIGKISEIKHIDNFHGFGLYDKQFVEILKKINEPHPYFRGLVAEFGFDMVEVEYLQGEREKGASKGSFYKLYDAAMLGFVNHSKVPLRLASFLGFFVAFLSIICGLGYFVYKLLYWDKFETGMAPVIMGLFFFSAVQLIFIGVIGEYIGAIYTQVKNRPLVFEKERINFDDPVEKSKVKKKKSPK